MTTPARTGRRPSLWEGIHRTLVTEIEDGHYPAGAKLPTEAELAHRFGVNRHTVRRALEAMTEEGRIHVRRGSGAWVTQGRFDYPIGPRTRFSRNLLDEGHRPGRRILRLETVQADRRAAAGLNLAEGDPVVVVESVSEADGVPIAFGRSTFPARRLPGIEVALAEHPRITEALAACGVTDYQRLWTRLIADRPGALIARHLQMPETHPVLRTEAVNIDPSRQPVEYGRTWFCSDRVQLVVDRTSFIRETPEGETR